MVVAEGQRLAVELAVQRTEIIVIEFQLRLSEEEDIIGQRVIEEQGLRAPVAPVPGAPIKMGSRRSVTSAKPGTKICTAAVAARAAQVNLNVNEATQRLIETAGRQMSKEFFLTT